MCLALSAFMDILFCELEVCFNVLHLNSRVLNASCGSGSVEKHLFLLLQQFIYLSNIQIVLLRFDLHY